MYEAREGGFRRAGALTLGAIFLGTAVLGFVVWSPVVTPPAGIAFRAALVDQGPGPTLAPGATTTYSLHFRNVGAVAWQRGTNKQVTLGVSGDPGAYADLGIAVKWLSADRVVTTSEDFVLPGMTGTFAFGVRAPMTPGVYRVPLRLVVEGVAWLEHDPVTLVVTSDLGFHAQLVDQSVHPTLHPGELSAPIVVRVRNSGARTWTKGAAGQQVNLGLAGDDKTMSLLGVSWPSSDRVAIQGEPIVLPGGMATFTFRIRAPQTPGTYPLRLRPVVDGVMWLEDEGVVTLITVVPPGSTPEALVEATADKVSFTPTFDVVASADPATVATTGSITITARFKATRPGTALIGVEVFAPSGATIAYQKWFQNESFASGEQRSYPVTWQVSSGAAIGTYTVNALAYAPGWKALYASKIKAASFAVTQQAAVSSAPPATAAVTAAPGSPVPTGSALPTVTGAATPTATPTAAPTQGPTFTTTASVAPSSLAAGGSLAVTAVVTSATATTGLVDIEIFAPGGTSPAYQVWFDNQSFAAGQQQAYPATWQVPTNAATGTYAVRLAVYAPGWAALYSSVSSAATFAVTVPATPSPTPVPTPTPGPTTTPTPTASPTPTPVPTASPAPSFTTSASVTPASVAPGGTISITATYTSATATTVIVHIYEYAPGGLTFLNQHYFENQTFSAGQQRSYTVSWQVPATSAAGTYEIDLAVFAPGWAARYNWTDKAATFGVTAPSATPTPPPTPAPTPTPPPTPPPSFSGLHVQGNRMLDAAGQPVVLRGVNRMNLSYSCVQGKGLADGVPLNQASVDAMKTWRINMVRVPLNEHCWLGLEGTPRGAPYQQGVEDYVNLLTANGINVLVDLHWSAAGTLSASQQDPMPNTDHSPDFWRSVANRFKNNPAVMFDLFNEPIPNNNAFDNTDAVAAAEWRCWRDGSAGGTCTGITYQRTGANAYTAAGMQVLVDAVRSTGATNVIVLSGIGWAGTLTSLVPAGHSLLTWKPNDPLNQLAASVHTYQNTWCKDVTCYNNEVAPVAASIPVIFGEFGNDTCDAAMLNALMSWADARGVGYVAWVWDAGGSAPCSAVKLILDNSGTPTQLGSIIKNHLASLP